MLAVKKLSIETTGWMRLKVKTRRKAKLQMNTGITFMYLRLERKNWSNKWSK